MGHETEFLKINGFQIQDKRMLHGAIYIEMDRILMNVQKFIFLSALDVYVWFFKDMRTSRPFVLLDY